MTVNITTGKIDVAFEAYVDGEKVVINQPNTMYSFTGNVVNFVKDFTTSDVAQFNIDGQNVVGIVHDQHRYNSAAVSTGKGAVFIEYTNTPSTTPAPIQLNSDGISVNDTSYQQGSYYLPSVMPGATIKLSQTKYENPYWVVANSSDPNNPLIYIGNDVEAIVE